MPDPARLVQIHLSEQDQCQGQPLHEAVVAKCRELGIAGATVLRGLCGYGHTGHLQHRQLRHSDAPLVVLVVDSPERVVPLIDWLETTVRRGVIAVEEVQARRVMRPAAP